MSTRSKRSIKRRKKINNKLKLNKKNTKAVLNEKGVNLLNKINDVNLTLSERQHLSNMLYDESGIVKSIYRKVILV